MLKNVLESQLKFLERFVAVENRTAEAETHISCREDTMLKMKKYVHILQTQLQKMNMKLQDQGNRNRRINLSIVGVPEEAEGDNCSEFVKNFLCELYGKGKVVNKSTLEIEKEHRALVPKPRDGGKPRSVVVKLLRFPDKHKY
ncbi:hypothetical protein EOD39_10818 [Acipenser ruthenus]|uniref:LINE-1 type transposase domain-containing protein 1 n=1 Tax=Acipenser ruthenus TaxID=7906 RepID=A0A662YSS3_ACIRT|nr:hypothetical protein EOD39_10818 [Acipenser ruthenus]